VKATSDVAVPDTCDVSRGVERAMSWIRANSVPDAGICRTDKHRVPYPEVTGYYIPTLLNWEENDLALRFGRWLVSVQNGDGSWSDYLGRAPYTFDTGQALKGLMALVGDFEEFEAPVRAAYTFLSGQIEAGGRVLTPDTSLWQEPYPIPETIHLYALSPMVAAARKWNMPRRSPAAERAMRYFLAQDDLTAFTSMSHFHAYVIEGLVDLGCHERARQGMREVEALHDEFGYVPALPGATWCCSTGQLQYAVIWYKLGERQRALRALSYVLDRQNESGGFYGGYGDGVDYHADEEIAWAVKFFLDAAWWELNR
jgi:malonyl-CoA O-methyltransferase